jgi:hypothetical protein
MVAGDVHLWLTRKSRPSRDNAVTMRCYRQRRTCTSAPQPPLYCRAARIASERAAAFRYHHGMGLCRLLLRFRRSVAILATFAVLLQLTVAATHHHPEDGFGAHVGARDRTASPVFKPLGHGQLPPASEAICPICLALALGAVFLQPVAVLLARPAAGRETFLSENHVATARHQTAFRSRAPPALSPSL